MGEVESFAAPEEREELAGGRHDNVMVVVTVVLTARLVPAGWLPSSSESLSTVPSCLVLANCGRDHMVRPVHLSVVVGQA